jgi:hypothetical protein
MGFATLRKECKARKRKATESHHGDEEEEQTEAAGPSKRARGGGAKVQADVVVIGGFSVFAYAKPLSTKT